MDKTLLKGLKIMEILARSEGPRGVTDLAAQVELTKSNVHRVLKTLESCGYLRREAKTGHYDLSLKLWELGSLVLSRFDLKREAAPQLELLADRTRETVHLSILDGSEVVYVDKIDSPEPVRAYSRIGGRSPAFAVATGKAMLAWQSPDYIAGVADRIERFTTRTVADAEELRQELARIRAQGFAVNKGEWRDTVCGLAAPIRDASGAVVAAIGISGPAERLKPKRLKELVAPVVEASAVISASLGYGGPAEFNRLHSS